MQFQKIQIRQGDSKISTLSGGYDDRLSTETVFAGLFFFVSCGAEENGQRLSGDVMQFSKVLSLHLSNLEVMSFSLEESFHCICETQEALRCQAHTHKHARYTHASNIILSAYIFQGYCYCFYVLIHSFPTYNYQFMPLLQFLPEVFVSIISKQLLFGE